MVSKRSYAEIISKSKVLVDAMNANQSSLSAKLDKEFITMLHNNIEEAAKLNTLQEKLKSDLKEQTAKLEDVIKQVNKQYAEAKKRIKLDFPQERWNEFGFPDKR